MITSVLSSRRAERYAQMLDEAVGARRHRARSTADSGLTELVALTQRVSTLPLVVEVDSEFRTGLRASLMARIEREGIGVTATEAEVEPPTRRRLNDLLPSTRTRGAIVVTMAAGTLAISGVSAASGSANPGDALYGVKRSTERAQLAFAGSDVSRGQLYFEFAKVRLAEAAGLGADAARLDPVLDDMDADMRQGSRLLTTTAVTRGDAAALTAIEQFAAQHRPELLALSGRLSGRARARANESVSLLDQISRRATGLQLTVRCPGHDVAVDDLGAVPTRCATSSPRQSTVPAGTAPETTPQPGDSPQTGVPAEPVGAVPSVEANSSRTPAKPGGNGDPTNGVIETIEDLFGGIFGD